jgi:hypothetical protein
MRILVLNADYPRFLAWFYRRQAELESALLRHAASLFGVADFYSKTSPRWATLQRRFTSTIHGSRPLGHANTAWRSKPPSGAIGRKAPPATSVSARIAQFAGCANLVLQWAGGSAGSCWQ